MVGWQLVRIRLELKWGQLPAACHYSKVHQCCSHPIGVCKKLYLYIQSKRGMFCSVHKVTQSINSGQYTHILSMPPIVNLEMTGALSYFAFYNNSIGTVINHSRFHLANSLENLLELQNPAQDLFFSWAKTAGYKYRHCQALLITPNRLFVGCTQVVEHGLGGSVALEFCPQRINESNMISLKYFRCFPFSTLRVIHLDGSMTELHSQFMRRPLSYPRQVPPIAWVSQLSPVLHSHHSYLAQNDKAVSPLIYIKPARILIKQTGNDLPSKYSCSWVPETKLSLYMFQEMLININIYNLFDTKHVGRLVCRLSYLNAFMQQDSTNHFSHSLVP